MKLPNSLTATSNRGEAGPESKPWKAHGCLPGIIVIGWLLYMIIPLIGNGLGFVVVLASPLGYAPALEAIGLPSNFAMVGGIGLFVVLLSLPWVSFLVSRISVTAVCTAGVIVLLLTHMSGCRKVSSEMSKIIWNRSQAQRACVMRPRVRRTLGIESSHISISPNPNGVPSKVECSSNSRGTDATPLGLVVSIVGGKSPYPGLFQPWAISRKPVGLERKTTDHAFASLRPRLASIKARNCTNVSARDGSRSKCSHRASNSRFSASVTSFEPPWNSMGVGRFMVATSGFLAPSQPCSRLHFAS